MFNMAIRLSPMLFCRTRICRAQIDKWMCSMRRVRKRRDEADGNLRIVKVRVCAGDTGKVYQCLTYAVY